MFASWRSMTKRAGSGSAYGSGSGMVLLLIIWSNAGQVNGAGGRVGGKVLHSCLLLPPLQHWGLRRQVPGDNPYFLFGWWRKANVSSDKLTRPVSIVVDLDPHSFGCPWSGSVLGSRSMEIDQTLQIDLVSSDKVTRPVSIVVDPDPHSFGCPCSGSVLGSRSMEIDQNLQIDLGSCLSKKLLYLRRRYVFWPISYFKYLFFHVKSAFCDFMIRIQIRVDPYWFGFLVRNPHWLKSWIRIRIGTKADPQHCPYLDPPKFSVFSTKNFWNFDPDLLCLS